MILGKKALITAFFSGKWRSYRGTTSMKSSELAIGPNSIDVSLGSKLLSPMVSGSSMDSNISIVDPRDENCLLWNTIWIPAHGFVLQPGGFVLGSVCERFECSEPLEIHGRPTTFAPMYDGRSTVGRIGIASHITAGFGDYGFQGAFTLEIYNHLHAPVRLYSGMRIGQVAFTEVYEPDYYSGAYSNDAHFDGPVAPVLGPSRF